MMYLHVDKIVSIT